MIIEVKNTDVYIPNYRNNTKDFKDINKKDEILVFSKTNHLPKFEELLNEWFKKIKKARPNVRELISNDSYSKEYVRKLKKVMVK